MANATKADVEALNLRLNKAEGHIGNLQGKDVAHEQELALIRERHHTQQLALVKNSEDLDELKMLLAKWSGALIVVTGLLAFLGATLGQWLGNR